MTGTDIIGDVHAAHDEFLELVLKLGYKKDSLVCSKEVDGKPDACNLEYWYHPEGRKIIQLGDLHDRSDKPIETFKLIRELIDSGVAEALCGNHEIKLIKVLKCFIEGKPYGGRTAHGLKETLEAIDAEGEVYKRDLYKFLISLPLHIETDEFIAVHAAYKDITGGGFKELCLFGEVDRRGIKPGEYPIRLNHWKRAYKGNKTIVHGHVVYDEVDVFTTEQNTKIYGIDTGCVFNGSLTALRLPEHEIVQVKAHKQYAVYNYTKETPTAEEVV